MTVPTSRATIRSRARSATAATFAASLELARQGAVNFHDGPLPAYAGLNAPVWAILNREATHGITWHLIEGGIEELPGPLAAQLAEGGRIIALFDDQGVGVVRSGVKLDGAITWRYAFNVGAPVLAGFRRAREFTL